MKPHRHKIVILEVQKKGQNVANGKEETHERTEGDMPWFDEDTGKHAVISPRPVKGDGKKNRTRPKKKDGNREKRRRKKTERDTARIPAGKLVVNGVTNRANQTVRAVIRWPKVLKHAKDSTNRK